MPTPEKLATDATVAIMLADGFEEVEALAVAEPARGATPGAYRRPGPPALPGA